MASPICVFAPWFKSVNAAFEPPYHVRNNTLKTHRCVLKCVPPGKTAQAKADFQALQKRIVYLAMHLEKGGTDARWRSDNESDLAATDEQRMAEGTQGNPI